MERVQEKLEGRVRGAYGQIHYMHVESSQRINKIL